MSKYVHVCVSERICASVLSSHVCAVKHPLTGFSRERICTITGIVCFYGNRSDSTDQNMSHLSCLCGLNCVFFSHYVQTIGALCRDGNRKSCCAGILLHMCRQIHAVFDVLTNACVVLNNALLPII